MTQKIHPLCDLFPPMSAEERAETLASIRDDGLTNPIWRWGSVIVDGKNRLSICEELGVKPDFREWRPSAKATSQAEQEAELWAFIRGQNLARRHLTTSQRAMIAADRATLQHGQRKSELQICNSATLQETADEMEVSKRSVSTAAALKKNGSHELIEAVKTGAVTLNDAAAVIDKPKAAQTQAVKDVKKGKAKTARQAIRQREPGEDPVEPEHKQPKATVQNGKATVVTTPGMRGESVEKQQYAALARAIDEIARMASMNNSPHHRAAIKHLGESLDEFKKLVIVCDKAFARK